mmetsp:Transcript_14028/g.34039  ORF Transcript_14028/g.34039 Transcript_14028/m.34039 type:complete len:512 (-) Transcript_14028:143-1678(-)
MKTTGTGNAHHWELLGGLSGPGLVPGLGVVLTRTVALVVGGYRRSPLSRRPAPSGNRGRRVHPAVGVLWLVTTSPEVQVGAHATSTAAQQDQQINDQNRPLPLALFLVVGVHVLRARRGLLLVQVLGPISAARGERWHALDGEGVALVVLLLRVIVYRVTLTQALQGAVHEFGVAVGLRRHVASVLPLAVGVDLRHLPGTPILRVRLVLAAPRLHLLLEGAVLVSTRLVLLARRQRSNHRGTGVALSFRQVLLLLAVAGVAAVGVALTNGIAAPSFVRGNVAALGLHLLHEARSAALASLPIGTADGLGVFELSASRHVGGQSGEVRGGVSHLLIARSRAQIHRRILKRSRHFQIGPNLAGVQGGPDVLHDLLRGWVPLFAFVDLEIHESLRLCDSGAVVLGPLWLGPETRHQQRLRLSIPPPDVQHVEAIGRLAGDIGQLGPERLLQCRCTTLLVLKESNVPQDHHLHSKEIVAVISHKLTGRISGNAGFGSNSSARLVEQTHPGRSSPS